MYEHKTLLLAFSFAVVNQVIAWENYEESYVIPVIHIGFQGQLEAALQVFFQQLTQQQNEGVENELLEIHVQHNQTEDGIYEFNIQLKPKESNEPD